MNFNAPEKNNPFLEKYNNIWDKAKLFIENTKKAVKDTLNKAWQKVKKIAWIGAIVWNSFVPASVETVSTISPLTSTTINAITLTTAWALFTACWSDDEEKDKDITPPNIFMDSNEYNISWSKQISINWNKLYLWWELLAAWTDDVDNNCKVKLTFNWQEINSWTMIDKSGTLILTVTDKSWNYKTQNIKINVNENIDSPEITLNKSEINILWSEKVNISNNQLIIWDEIIASWTDKSDQNCTVSLKFNDNEIKSWDTIEWYGKLILTITNNKWKSSIVEIIVKNESIYWLENLKNLNIKVDQEIDLLQWISFAEWISLVKTDIEIDWTRKNIPDPSHFTPEYPWNCNIIFTVQWKNWNTAEIKSDNLIIKAIEYKSVEIKDLQPKEILPIVWQINSWDKKAYEHIEHLRIAEGTRIRDMMWKYWTWKYSPEEYQKLMLRLHTWTIWYKPLWFDNYEIVWKDFLNGIEHEHNTRDILNSIIKHANFIIIEDYSNAMEELYNNQPNNSINIFGKSWWTEVKTKNDYIKENTDYFNLKEYINKDNFLRFLSGSNLSKSLKKIYQENTDLTENSIYCIPQSNANSKNDTNINKHIFITIWTDKDWNVDISNSSNGSKFPIWFHPDILFSWRTFPYNTLSWNIHAEDWNYVTSYTNYTNLAMTDLCFQMKADIPNVDQLMSMIRNTSLTNQIHLNWQTQDLHLINPAWFIKEYLMPTPPTEINEWTTISLQKWEYLWIIFDIPWAEVNINWEWIPYNKDNQSIIKSQNPFNLKWRLNWKLAKKMWYNKNNPIKWKIIITDENFNWLNISKDVSINIK